MPFPSKVFWGFYPLELVFRNQSQTLLFPNKITATLKILEKQNVCSAGNVHSLLTDIQNHFLIHARDLWKMTSKYNRHFDPDYYLG